MHRNDDGYFIEDFMIGLVVSAFSKALIYPLEMIQSKQNVHKSSFPAALKNFLQTSGYRFLLPQSRFFWTHSYREALKFAFSDYFKRITPYFDHRTEKLNYIFKTLILSGLGGISPIFLYYPYGHVRLLWFQDNDARYHSKRTLAQFAKAHFQEKGLSGFYKGVEKGLPAQFLYRTIFFGGFDIGLAYTEDIEKSFRMKLAVALGTTTLANIICYPFESAKNFSLKERDRSLQHRLTDFVEILFTNHGWKGLYSGFAVTYKLIAQGTLNLLLYDYGKSRLSHSSTS